MTAVTQRTTIYSDNDTNHLINGHWTEA